MMKMFHFRSPKTTLTVFFYLIEKTFGLHLVPEDFYEKRIVWKNWVKIIWKYAKLSYVEFRIHTENDLCFCKSSANQTFTFMSSKLVYFKKHLAYQV